MMRHIGFLAILGVLVAMFELGLGPQLGDQGQSAAGEPLPVSHGLAWND